MKLKMILERDDLRPSSSNISNAASECLDAYVDGALDRSIIVIKPDNPQDEAVTVQAETNHVTPGVVSTETVGSDYN